MTDTHVQHHRPEPQHGPVEEGVTLATFDRNRGTERLRVSLEEFNGYGFVRLQAWQINRDGEWWPCKGRCITVKIHETGQLAAVLANVARQHEASRLPGPDRGRGTDRGPVSEDRYLGRRRDAPASRNTSTWHRPQPQRALPPPRASAGPSNMDLDQGPPFEPTKGGQGHAPFDELD
jgi:hypothetical protein